MSKKESYINSKNASNPSFLLEKIFRPCGYNTFPFDLMEDALSKNKEHAYDGSAFSRALILQTLSEMIQDKHSFSIIQHLLQRVDYRLVSDFLFFMHQENRDVFERFYHTSHPSFFFKTQYQKYLKHPCSLIKTIRFTSLKDLFARALKIHEMGVFLSDQADPSFFNAFQKLLTMTQGNIDSFIEAQHDLAGVNALVRRGLVKKIYLPNHSIAISKKNNPDKKGRFEKEQNNILEIKKKLKLFNRHDFISLNSTDEREVHLKLIRPFAVIKSHEGYSYALSCFENAQTLEEFFLKNKNAQERQQILKEVRSILDLLYEKGIIWGDMAPRNILINLPDTKHGQEGTQKMIKDGQRVKKAIAWHLASLEKESHPLKILKESIVLIDLFKMLPRNTLHDSHKLRISFLDQRVLPYLLKMKKELCFEKILMEKTFSCDQAAIQKIKNYFLKMTLFDPLEFTWC